MDIEDIFLGFLYVVLISVVVLIVAMVGQGSSVVSHDKGYCRALHGQYFDGEGLTGLCIKNNRVIKEFK